MLQRSGNADASVATRALADAHPTLFRSGGRRQRSVPAIPPDTALGNCIIGEMRSCPICMVTGEPGTGKTKDMPIALLGSLLARCPQPQGIAVIMETKETQNALLDHVCREQPDIAKWFSIWNGDPDGNHWPRYESFIILVQPLSFFWRVLRSSPKADDVQHRIYDEIHDASAWQLFHLSHDISRLVADPGCGLNIFLMSATLETPIWQAIQAAVRRSFGGVAMGHVKLRCPPGVPSPAERTKEIPARLLPENFDDLEWEHQACFCTQAIRTWAHKGCKSAAILIIVPGEAEMLKFIALWIAFSKDHSWNVYRVDSHTAKKERQRIRDVLRTQKFRPSEKDSIVVATNVFEKGITLWINGLIDTGLTVFLDSNGFLKVGLCTPAQTVQRKGRGGRIEETLWKALTPKHSVVQPAAPYEMPKSHAMSVIVGSVLLQKHFPIIGISQANHALYFKELEDLGIISKHTNVSILKLSIILTNSYLKSIHWLYWKWTARLYEWMTV